MAEPQDAMATTLLSNNDIDNIDPPRTNQPDEDAEQQQSLLPTATEKSEREREIIRPPDDSGGVSESGVRNLDVIISELEKQEPKDRYKLVYIIMVLHGISLLISWNMFITAKSYYEDYKLKPVNRTDSAHLKEYREKFMTNIGMACQYPGTAMNLVNLFVQCGGRGKAGVRIVGSIVIIIIVFVITIILSMVDSSDWPEGFFWVTIFSAVITSSASGVYQNSLMGVVAILPMRYTNAVIFGNNICGTFVALLNILLIPITTDSQQLAMYYFLMAVVILLVAMDSYFVLPHTKFFRHYERVIKLKQDLQQILQPQQTTCMDSLRSYWAVLKQIWVLAISVWFVFFVSLALYPQIQSDIKRIDFPISDVYWTPVFCFLSFNVCAMLGNILSEIVRIPSPRWVWIPVALRAGFIPLYLLSNFRPGDRPREAPMANDYAYIVYSVLMAFSGGYLSSLCMMYGPAKLQGRDASTAGMMMAFFLVLGILSGVSAARLLVQCV